MGKEIEAGINNPFVGINRIRFVGYNLSPDASLGTPLFTFQQR